jgi:hypothetical protein
MIKIPTKLVTKYLFAFSPAEPCPTNFSRVGAYCYHFSERELNWKSSASMCRALGSRLAELETVEENQDIVAHMQATSALRGTVLLLKLLQL